MDKLIKKQPREISIEGCEIIGNGLTGECYRIDGETILKLYFGTISDALVENEKKFAKAALIAGLPTAISFDIVTCQGRRGVIYEMITGDTLSQKIVDEPEKLEENVKLFADLCRQIHTTKGDPAVLSKVEDVYAEEVFFCSFFNEKQKDALAGLIRSIPNEGNCVHGDLHTRNIMIQDDKPLLIDMGELAIGSEWYDIAEIFLVYFISSKSGLCRQIVHMEPELAMKVWKLFLKYYFGVETEEAEAEVVKKAAFFVAIRCMHMIAMNVMPEERLLPVVMMGLPDSIKNMK